MLAALSYGKKDIRVENIQIPRINENEILIKIEKAGICGTDVRIYQNGLDDNKPNVLGHEFSGKIEKVGGNIKKFKKGMRVTANPNMGCGTCNFCVSGNFHMCRDYYALGVQINGSFSEYLRIPEAFIENGNLIEIPEKVSFESAALVEPLSCVYNGITHTGVKPGDTTLIIGAGPIGLMFAKLAVLMGSSTVVLSNRSTARLELAKKVNPNWIAVQSDKLKNTVSEVTNGKGVDVCIVAASSPSAQKQALENIGVFGRINFFGGLPKDSEDITINSNDFHYKQINLTGTTKSNNMHFRKSMELIEKEAINVKELITSQYSIQEFNKALENSIGSKGLKTIISFN